MRVLTDEVDEVGPGVHAVADDMHIEDVVSAAEKAGLGLEIEQTIDVMMIKQAFGDDVPMMNKMLRLFLGAAKLLIVQAYSSRRVQE